MARDGSLVITDDGSNRVWRVVVKELIQQPTRGGDGSNSVWRVAYTGK